MAETAEKSAQGAFDYSFVNATARIALYDDMKSAPRITSIEPAPTADFIEHLASAIDEQSKRLGGKPVVEKIRVREPQIDRGEETIPVVIFLTPEAKQLWSEQFDPNEETKSIDIALIIDGVVYKRLNFTSLHGVTNNSFFIHWKWGKDKLDDFCTRLMKQ